MRHFGFLADSDRAEVFSVAPEVIDRQSPRELLAQALGAVLYTPANHAAVGARLLGGRIRGLSAMVLCLEDAIGDGTVEAAEAELLATLARLGAGVARGEVVGDDLPLLFVRIRDPAHLQRVGPRLVEHLDILSGVVLPKFSSENAERYLRCLDKLATSPNAHHSLLAMPILETPDVIYRESRTWALERIVQLIDDASEQILCVRLGGTDFSALFGLRRSVEMTIWDIQVIRDCIGDVVNHLGRRERQIPVSAPVWEYFYTDRRVLKPQLRTTPFLAAGVAEVRERLLDRAVDGLIREVLLDQANGLVGKTVIHPSHILPVHALMAVTHEEHQDALAISAADRNLLGAMPSPYSNKMNEVRPHALWAQRVLLRARCFGVLARDHSWVSLLEVSEQMTGGS